MDLNAYQDQAAQTAVFEKWCSIQYVTMALASEAGEVAGKISKAMLASSTPEMFADAMADESQRRAIAGELGDVLWDVAVAARLVGYSLNEVASMNLDKVNRRLKNGTVVGSGDDR